MTDTQRTPSDHLRAAQDHIADAVEFIQCEEDAAAIRWAIYTARQSLTRALALLPAEPEDDSAA